MGKKLLITENERNQILQMYNITESNYIFDIPHITIDGRYIIYNDELYDYNINENLGDLFSIKNLKLIFENINPEFAGKNIVLIEEIKSLLSSTIKNEKLLMESVKNSIKNNLILEQNKFAENIIGKGVLYIARKVKSLLWSFGGMTLDAFLVTSGIGKSVQWIPWAICLGIDVYEWSTGDYGNPEDKNTPLFWKILNIGFDILGMLTTGPMAKAASYVMKPFKFLKNEKEIGVALSKSPKALNIVNNINGSLSKVGGRFEELLSIMSQKSPKLYTWLSGLTSKLSGIISYIGKILGKILSFAGKTSENFGNKIQKGLSTKSEKIGNYLSNKSIGKGFKNAANTSLIGGGISGTASLRSKLNNNNLESIIRNNKIKPSFNYGDI